MGRAPCCQKVGLKRGRWTAEEDQTLIKYIQDNGEGSWRSLPKNAGLLRCGKSCRLRWINYLRTDLKRGSISPQEEDLIIKLHATLGNRWSLIASQLSGRTDNEIKNHWNSHLRRSINTWRRPANDTLPQHILDNLAKMMAKPNSSTKKESKKNRAQAKKSESPNHVEIDVVVVGDDDDSKDNPQTPDACRETLLCRNSWSYQSVQSIFSPEDQPEADEQGLEMGMDQLLMMPQHLTLNEIQKSATVDFDLVNDPTDFSTSHAEMGSSWFPTCSTTLDTTTTTKKPSPSPSPASLHSFDHLTSMSTEWNWEDCVQTPDQDLMNLEVGSYLTCLWDGVNVANSGL